MALKLRQIEAFRTVMREGSMVRASAAMSITQPAVSYLIASLETSVGFSLFSRQGGKLTATPEALKLMAEVDRLYDGIQSIEAAARQIANYERDVLRVLITQPLSSGRIVNCIGKFVSSHPGLRLTIDVDMRSTIVHRISSGQADLGICSLGADMEPVGTHLFSSELVCVSKPGVLPELKAVTPDHLVGVGMVGLTTKGLIRSIVDEWFTQARRMPNYIMEATDAAMAVELIRAGAPASIVSSLSLPDTGAPGVITYPLSPSRKVEIGAIFPTSQHPHRAVKALVDFLKKAIVNQQ